jgi:hypothetical protein
MTGVPVVSATDARHVMRSRCVMPDNVINPMMLDHEVDPPVRMVDTNLDIKYVTQ